MGKYSVRRDPNRNSQSQHVTQLQETLYRLFRKTGGIGSNPFKEIAS
ncbi:hypothetical protein VCR15J2_20174 [Vibrio coralliirubri]|nr:hypothetical protein VCR15J2_20174 [Vibrio coralliirubri]